ncbi:tail assembly chaperone [Aerococcaceae bacterium WGS1372]
MAFTFTIAGKEVEINFNYRLMFKVQKELATVNKETGEKNNDGVGVLFSAIVNEDDKGLVDLIRLCLPKGKKIEDNEIIEGIERAILELDKEDTEAGYSLLFEHIKDEMIESGFFKKKISKYIENMQQITGYLEEQEDKESQMQIKLIKKQIGEMESAMS